MATLESKAFVFRVFCISCFLLGLAHTWYLINIRELNEGKKERTLSQMSIKILKFEHLVQC